MSVLTDKLDQYLATDTVFASVFHYTRQRFEAAPQLYAHNFDHARRDVINAIAIGEPEGANMHIVLCAAVMHDIGYLYGAHRKVHGDVGADHVGEFLAEGDIALPQADFDHIQACIRTHKGVIHGIEPATLEAKIVADADHLDKYGPIGIYQTALAMSEFGLTPQDAIYRWQSRHALPLLTKTGEELARPLRAFTQQFGAQFARAYEQYHNAKNERTQA